MEENDCKNARLRRKFVLQQRLNARNIRSESEKLVHNTIQRKPLQELHLNLQNNNNFHNITSRFQSTIVSENNISNSSTTLVEDPIEINLMTSQFAASTITYNTPCVVSNNIDRNYGQNNYNCSAGATSAVQNHSYSVSNNKVVKYPFQVIQSLQNRFNLDDETTTEQHCLDTTNDDSTRTTYEGDSTSTTITNELYCKGELQGNVTHNCIEFQT
ncbi:hypothetical protein DEO72_LG3g1080 [Vigna unguiculata]|uniref:Uncharacterized protein n=1 Tax=Vigna unguiculata TaxID=3917 RepID=A0A4D6LD99_VIGUN|nr:hypothetical protein DEO72_LG3g1080 [Vigna unguiculata]